MQQRIKGINSLLVFTPVRQVLTGSECDIQFFANLEFMIDRNAYISEVFISLPVGPDITNCKYCIALRYYV